MTAREGAPKVRMVPDSDRLRSFWAVYEPAQEEIATALESALGQHPELRAVLDRQSEAEREQQRQVSQELLQAAVVEGRWQGYEAYLGEQGSFYAKLGMSFDAWMTTIRAFHTLVSERIVAAYRERPEELSAAFDGMQEFTDFALGVIGETYLAAKEDVIRRQHEAITELATPVLPIAEGMLVLPLVGVIDSARAAQLTEHLLNAIRAYRARVTVIDITGVPAVDSAVANHLLQTVQAVRLMGARAIVSGLSAANAQILVRIGVDLSMLHTVSDLQAAVEEANTVLGRRVQQIEVAGKPQ